MLFTVLFCKFVFVGKVQNVVLKITWLKVNFWLRLTIKFTYKGYVTFLIYICLLMQIFNLGVVPKNIFDSDA